MLITCWGHKIDSAQFGGRKGYSVTLYLIKLVDFILKNLETSRGVMLGLIDFSKAYNRQCHNRLLTCFNDLGTPPYLLKILQSYLTNRRMKVRHKGDISDTFELPGSGPQGTNLGVLSFIVYVNSCGVPLDNILDCLNHEHKEAYIGLPNNEFEKYTTQNLGWTRICHPILPTPNYHVQDDEARFKYVDDKALAVSFDLKELKQINIDQPRPLNYRDRTLHYLPEESNILQKRMIDVEKFCKVQKMIINEDKTITAMFNTATTKDSYPRIHNSNGTEYENVENFKLLGVKFTTDSKRGVRWDQYIDTCIQKFHINLWIIKRLKEQGVTLNDLIMVYCSKVRVHLEQNSALWNESITKTLSDKIERQQKTALYVMLGGNASSDYKQNLEMTNLETLIDRRKQLSTTFAEKTNKHPEHGKLFKDINISVDKAETRFNNNIRVPTSKTRRYETSAVPSLAKLLFDKLKRKKKNK